MVEDFEMCKGNDWISSQCNSGGFGDCVGPVSHGIQLIPQVQGLDLFCSWFMVGVQSV